MTRTPLALLLSVALALPQLTAPAFADQRGYTHRHGVNGPVHPAYDQGPSFGTGDGAGAAIAVLGGLAIAPALAKQARDRREEEEAREQRRRDEARKRNEARRHNERNHGHGHGQNRRRAPLQVLPERCFRRGNGPHGEWRGWSARCLQRNVAQPRLLPYSCLRTVETWNGPRDVYRNRCLRRSGWFRQYARH